MPSNTDAITKTKFSWPNGARAGVSLAFDDSRVSQLDHGVPLFEHYRVRATFYVVPSFMEARREDWKRAADCGHEIGAHTVHHPCSGNFGFVAPQWALENLTLDQIEAEIIESNRLIESWTGTRPATFAYPCGHKFVGRGTQVRSYVPTVAKHYLVGRGWRDEFFNVPERCDLAQVAGTSIDALTFGQVKPMLDDAAREGHWLILAGHDIGPSGGGQTARTDTLSAICHYCADPANGLWLDTVATIGAHIRKTRGF